MSFELVLPILEENGIKLAGHIVDMPSVFNGIFIPAHVKRASDGTITPTKITFIKTKSQLELIGYVAEFLFINEQSEELEQSLRSSLLVNFPEIVRNVFLSLDKSKSNVWIDQKKSLDAIEIKKIITHVEQFVLLFRLPPASILTLSDISLPTRLELLRIIRMKSPIDPEGLSKAMTERGMTVPSVDWINRQFDLLRKGGLVVRRGDSHYALTLGALQRLGTSKSRKSPDIQRLLALARSRV